MTSENNEPKVETYTKRIRDIRKTPAPPKRKTNSIPISVRLPEAAVEKLIDAADTNGVPVSEIARRIILKELGIDQEIAV